MRNRKKKDVENYMKVEEITGNYQDSEDVFHNQTQ